jgi:hypothetical protein
VLGVFVIPATGSASVVLFAVLAIAVVVAFLAGALFHTTLSGIYSAVLYRYAVNGSGTPGFDGHVLDAAFQRKS